MAKKKASASGCQLAARDLSLESHMANLKTLNSRLLKSMMELRSEQSSLAADREIIDAVERDVFRLILSGAAEKMIESAESAIVELNSAEMRLVVVEEKDGGETDLERVVEERDLSQRDLDAKSKECEMLEEELRSVMRDKDIVQRFREDDKRLIEKLGREMEVMVRENNLDMKILKAENKEKALKVDALEEECRLLKELRGQLEYEVGELKVSLEELRKEKVGMVADYAEVKKSFFIKSDLLKKEMLKQKNYILKEKEMTLQINDLKGVMIDMKAEKDLADQRKSNYEIQIRNLQENISKLQFAKKCLADAHRFCIEKITRKETECAAMQREKNLKVEAVVALKWQLTESMNAKQMVELKLEELQKKLNHLNGENQEKKKQIDSLMVEKASLEKHRETSIQGLDDMEKELKTFEDSCSQLFLRLNKTITEVIGQESAQHNFISRETGAKVEKNEEMKLFVDNVEAITLVVKDKETKIKELNQELELLQLFVAHAKNKKGIRKWLFPATTIFVVASLAYAARRS